MTSQFSRDMIESYCQVNAKHGKSLLKRIANGQFSAETAVTEALRRCLLIISDGDSPEGRESSPVRP